MSRTNADLLHSAAEVLQGLGVRGLAGKAEVLTPGNMAAGTLMTQVQAHRLVDLTVAESQILGEVTVVKKAQRAGTIPKMDMNQIVARKAPADGEPGTASSRPTTAELSYRCVRVQATQFISVQAIREARATGEPDFEAKVRRAFMKAFSNNLAGLGFLGDTDLPPTTPENALYCTLDGWLKQARNGRALHYTTQRGQAFDPGLMFHLKRRMPRRFRNNTANRFMYESLMDLAWRENRVNAGDSGGTPGPAERALTQAGAIPWLGENSLFVPQLPTDLGFATVTASTAAADNVATAGGGIAFRVNTVLGGAASGNAGRVLRITCTETGESEEVVVTWDGTHNLATTEGTLGQSVVSTTAGDYTIDLADLTPVLYGPPQNLFMVICDEVRSYSKIEQEAERLRTDLFLELDVGIFEPEALVMQDGIALVEGNNPWRYSL